MAATTNVVISDNLLFGINGDLTLDNDVAHAKNTLKNPLFVNAGSHDASSYNFGLQANSPAKDKADANFAPSEDFLGFARAGNPDLGAYEYNASLAVDDVVTSKFMAYPNPFSDHINITASNSVNGFEMYSVTGQKIELKNNITDNGNNSYKIGFNHLSSGLYFLKVDSKVVNLIKK
ncbi:T9SS type A sorting domain-containing protein [Aureibaculum sp. 2210JD6-5]|uniref:T9SS type A sorting domain-containing protein n=1 Tax=Aureibaculum sp. 2210JD6-5 TaxID=3103957 RepID=UPI002AAE1077|nr:T9SS type A sorting domain-containing protein [Aureibaculum sp. 2210JD6-5]MDY7396809.1 T9SS type A sorting domain-containing protein [Aureibaculum sp. 2210JD6-5]